MAKNDPSYDIRELAEKWAKGTLTADEQAYLEKWYAGFDDEEITLSGSRHENSEDLRMAMLSKINAEITGEEKPVRRLWPRIAAAASILLILSAGGYFLLQKKQPRQQLAQTKPIDIKPGSKRAILQLANGQQIALNEAPPGKLAQQGNATVTKTADGQVNYYAQNSAPVTTSIYNTITTQRGGFYPLKLSDGTIAILDAASSIKYPVAFTGSDRVVEVTGQVYFEVAHNAKPFRVKVKGQIIEDLGTHFNVNAYDDETLIRTTLVEGSIRVTKNSSSVIIKPGQQALTAPTSDEITLKNVNTDDIIAWKNGQTSFKNEDIKEIMRQVSRWYDVDVAYQGNLPKTPFVGGISRSANLSDLLKILEFNDVHFTVDGKKIIVKP